MAKMVVTSRGRRRSEIPSEASCRLKLLVTNCKLLDVICIDDVENIRLPPTAIQYRIRETARVWQSKKVKTAIKSLETKYDAGILGSGSDELRATGGLYRTYNCT